MDISNAFGEVLRKTRKERELSQEELAANCSLDRTFISLMERGERQPSLKTIFVLAEELKVSPSHLVSQVEKMCHKSPRRTKN